MTVPTAPVARRGDPDVPARVLVGASAGGLSVLRRLLAGLPADLPAAVLAVVHLPPVPRQRLADVVGAGCRLPVTEAGPSQPIVAGRVLVAAPDRHLEVAGALAVQSDSPPRHGVRPSVDVLFTTAAAAYGPRVVAVVLSGAMRDGAVGASTVERAGGQVLVQDPDDALVGGMPASALAATVHHRVATGDLMAAVVSEAVGEVVTGRCR